jgi:hypothetical protein
VIITFYPHAHYTDLLWSWSRTPSRERLLVTAKRRSMTRSATSYTTTYLEELPVVDRAQRKERDTCHHGTANTVCV